MDGPKKRDQQPQFDPNAFSLLKVYRMSGERGLRERLGEIEESRHLQALAKAQQISMPPSLRGKDADLSRLKEAIVRGVISRDGQRTPAEPGTQQVTISLRVPAALKTRLEERAAASHRNLSQEAERALERSFSPEALFFDAADQLSPLDWNTAGGHLRRMLLTRYGEHLGGFGFYLLEEMAMSVLSQGAGNRHRIPRSTIDHFKTVIEVLEQTTDIVEGKDEKSQPSPVLAVRDAMRLHIATGTWKVNAAIPSLAELVSEFGVKLETVRQALELIERDGLIVRRAGEALRKPTRPIFLVAASASPPEALRA